MTLEEKLNLWVELTGVDPSEEKTSYTFKMNGVSDWDVTQWNKRIQEAITYDPSGTFAEAYLGEYFTKYVQGRNITIEDVLINPEVADFIDKSKRLFDAIKESDTETKILNEAMRAMQFYDLACDALTVFDVIELRTSAMRCMDGKLRVLQFSSGDASKDGFKMSKDVFMYRDMDALLLCAARNEFDGVSMGYIRDGENLTESFFSFIIKNGDNLYLLTDIPKHTTPLKSKMKRTPGRDMEERIKDNFFPYQTVAGIDVSDLWGSGRYGTSEMTERAELLKDGDEQTDELLRVKIGTFESMSQYEAFWAVMMISMIKDRFYESAPQYELSYTGSMISSAQIASNENTLIIRSKLPSMELSDISIKDTEGLEYDGQMELIGMNDYLVERYRDEVDPNALNLIKGTERFQIADKTYSYKEETFLNEYAVHPFVPFDTSLCGTKEEILYDQKWIERYNYAQQIKLLAERDYDEHYRSILEAVQKLIDARVDEICKMHIREEITACRRVEDHDKWFGHYKTKKCDYSTMFTFDEWYTSRYYSAVYGYGYNKRDNKADMKCYFSGTAPSVVIHVKPTNAQELAFLCGCEVTGLPAQIQHWSKLDIYTGNPILSNIDPMVWLLKDPFNKMEFSINILLSKKTYIRLCKEAGVAPVRFWQKEKPVCYKAPVTSHDSSCVGKLAWDRDTCERKMLKKCLSCKWRVAESDMQESS